MTTDVDRTREAVGDKRRHRALMFAVRFRAWLFGRVFTAGALCLVFRDNRDLLLVRPRYRPGWGLPGGFMRTREQPEAAVLRELVEEVGIVGAAVSPIASYVQEGRRHIDHLFVARVRDHEIRRPRVAIEIAEVRWYALDSLPPLQPEAEAALAVWAERGGEVDA